MKFEVSCFLQAQKSYKIKRVKVEYLMLLLIKAIKDRRNV